MNETFNLKRFWTFFRYDLRQMWRRNAKPAMFIGGGGIILLVLWAFFSMVIFFIWTTPPLWARIAGLGISYTILQMYMTRSYGFLTDRRRGSDYLMIPASTLEKFISMMIVILIVIPFLFCAVYYVTDALICLAFPASGISLFGATGNLIHTISEADRTLRELEMPMNLSVSSIFTFFSLSGIYSLLFYVLCGTIFKRFKILWALLISFVVGTILSSVLTIYIGNVDFDVLENGPEVIHTVFTATKIFMIVASIAMAAGLYFRLKKIQH